MTESRSSVQSSSHFFLPKLKDGSDGREGIEIKPGSVGEWDAQPEIAFQQVASSLEVPASGQESKSVSSIPDMWARPLSMEMALHNRRYPIRAQMIEQWQGMLTAIALAEVRGFDLKAELLVLQDFVAHDRLAYSLFELLPSPKNALYSLNGNNPWQELYIFLWNNEPVGMSSPSTLICPSEEGDWSGLPWWSGGRLRSPIAPYDHLNIDEKNQLRQWLEVLRQEISAQQTSNQPAKNEVTGLLREFQQQLGNLPGQTLKPSANRRFFGVELRPLRSLSTPIQAIPQPSSVKLIPSATKQTTADLLIIPEAHRIMREWGLPAQNIWIQDTTNLATFKPEAVPVSGLMSRWSVQCLREVDIFAPELAFVVQARAFPGGLMPKGMEDLSDIYEGKTITPLLPINPILLDYLTPEDLAEMMQVKRVDTTMGPQVEFVLDLPLSGPALSGSSPSQGPMIYRVTKVYALKKENVLPDVPVVEVWPNFRTATWQAYYAFYYDPDLDTFQVKFPKATETYNFKGIGSIHLSTASMSDTSSSCQLAQLAEFPTYIDCRGKGQLSLGLIVLKTPPEVGTTTGIDWKVGVDFGTSFTNVYLERNGTVSQLKLNPLHCQVTDSNIEFRQNALQEYFIFNNLELPLSTVLTTRGGKGDAFGVLDGRIYIPRDSTTFKPDTDDWIRTNLKWSPESLSYNRLFLKTLILQITAQAAINNAKAIDWSISYPSAFSKGDRNTYARNWRNLTQAIEDTTGIAQNCPVVDNTTRYRTESLAVAQYFADFEMPGRKNKLDLVNSTCIDIGGGTADISIWEENQLIHQCSIQLAGKDIFSQFIQLNPGFLERQFRIKTEEWRKLQGFQFFVKLDVFMRRESAGWLERRRDMVADDPEFQGLLQLMALGLSGVYYYVGLILRTLHQEGIYKTSEITPVFVGGNGGRLLHWLAEGGVFDRYSEVNELFSAMMSCASGFEDIEVKTELSPFPKDEVACGLVLTDTHLKGLDKHQNDPLVAGEAYTLNGETFDWNSRMQINGQINSWEVAEVKQLSQFLKVFHQTLQNKSIGGVSPFKDYELTDTEDANSILWRETNRELKKVLLNMRGEAESVRIEPPFILGLKALLQVLGRRWADHWK